MNRVETCMHNECMGLCGNLAFLTNVWYTGHETPLNRHKFDIDTISTIAPDYFHIYSVLLYSDLT